MAKKKKTERSLRTEPSGRPPLIGIVCLVTGVVGGLYWYDSAGSTQGPSGWNEVTQRWDTPNAATVLIEPNTNEQAAQTNGGAMAGSQSPVYSTLPEDLVGAKDVELRPYTPLTLGTLEDRVAREPLPVLPINRPEVTPFGTGVRDPATQLASSRPPVWTNESIDGVVGAQRDPKYLASSPLGLTQDWDSTNPFLGTDSKLDAKSSVGAPGVVSGKDALRLTLKSATQWPDENLSLPTEKNLHPVPLRQEGGLLSVTKIHPTEDPPKRTDSRRVSEGPKIESLPAGWNAAGGKSNFGSESQETKKSRAVIRQPRSGL
jgi:hypothetical protein